MKPRQIIGAILIVALLTGTALWVAHGQPLPGNKTTVTLEQ